MRYHLHAVQRSTARLHGAAAIEWLYSTSASNADGRNMSDSGDFVTFGFQRAAAAPQNQHMCDHCGALGKDLSRCVRCQHAHYCGKACQKAAWRGHKATCKQLCEELEERERVRGRRLFYHDVYLVDILHVRSGCLELLVALCCFRARSCVHVVSRTWCDHSPSWCRCRALACWCLRSPARCILQTPAPEVVCAAVCLACGHHWIGPHLRRACLRLQPDKLLQCRFWFKMLLSTLWTRESESNWEGRYIALRHLIRFLWLYTGLPLGHGLLLMLQRAVDDVRNALRREPPSVRPRTLAIDHIASRAAARAALGAQRALPALPVPLQGNRRRITLRREFPPPRCLRALRMSSARVSLAGYRRAFTSRIPCGIAQCATAAPHKCAPPPPRLAPVPVPAFATAIATVRRARASRKRLGRVSSGPWRTRACPAQCCRARK